MQNMQALKLNAYPNITYILIVLNESRTRSWGNILNLDLQDVLPTNATGKHQKFKRQTSTPKPSYTTQQPHHSP